MDRRFDIQKSKGWMEVSSGRTVHVHHVRAELQSNEGMDATGAEEIRQSAESRQQQG